MVIWAKTDFPSCASIEPHFLYPTLFSSVCYSTVGTLMCMLILAWLTVSLHTGAAAEDSVFLCTSLQPQVSFQVVPSLERVSQVV